MHDDIRLVEATHSRKRQAVAYLRASTRKQHLSCDDQLQAIQSYCRREDLHLVRIFRDDGISGTKGRGDRAGWDKLLDSIEAGGLTGGIVVVWSLDRWARDFRAGLLAAWAVGDHQVEIHTTDTGRVDLDSIEGQLMSTLKLALAAQESRERGRRVRERKQQHIEAGHWPTRPPYGYRLEGPHGRKVLLPCAAEAPTVLLAYQLYDQGLSYGQIAAALHDRRLYPRSGISWSRTSLQRILAGWSYGGHYRSADGCTHPVACKTFVPHDLWERCRDRAKTKGGKRGRRPVYALSGLVICGVCLRCMRVHSWPTQAHGPRRVYRCPGREVRDCDNKTIPRLDALEWAVLSWWLCLTSGPDLRQIVTEAIHQEHAEAIAVAATWESLDTELTSLDEQEQHLVDGIREVGVSPIISRDLARVRRRRNEVAGLLLGTGAAVPPIDILAAEQQLMEELRAARRPAALRPWIDNITVQPDRRVVVRGLGREAALVF